MKLVGKAHVDIAQGGSLFRFTQYGMLNYLGEKGKRR